MTADITKDFLAALSSRMTRALNNQEAELAAREPKIYRNSQLMDGGTGYTYYVDERRRTHTRWCVSTKKNVAGYYLIWRERINKKGHGTRDKWDSSKDKRELLATARINAGVS